MTPYRAGWNRRLRLLPASPDSRAGPAGRDRISMGVWYGGVSQHYPTTMQERIVKGLGEIEKEHGLRVLFAVESGSRAWGFASPNSDWDVRFVYCRDTNHYLSIDVEHKRDVIEVGGELDLVGWDIRKALKLYVKSNPSIMEWISSASFYTGSDSYALRKLVELRPQFYSPLSSYWHYMSMARGNWNSYLRERSEVSIKKYLYVMRGILSARWVGTYLSQPPLNFSMLLQIVDDPAVLSSLGQILMKKVSSDELLAEDRISVLDQFIEAELEGEEFKPTVEKPNGNIDTINSLFRTIIATAL